MKLTRFGQSCILIESKEKRILIDPGDKLWEESLLTDHWINIDVLLVTHKHHDHCEVKSIQEITKQGKTKFYTTQEVATTYPELTPKIVKQGDVLKEDEITINVVKAVHGYVPLFKGGKGVDENVGYIIDDGDKKVYITSDTICFENDYKCDVIVLPVSDHGVTMGPWEAALYAKESGAQLVIPVHYDNPDKHPANFKEVRKEFGKQGLNYKFLELKGSIEV